MKRKFEVKPIKTYANEKNMDRAVENIGFEDIPHFTMITPEGRYFPVFVGQEALSRGVHFHFNVVG